MTITRLPTTAALVLLSLLAGGCQSLTSILNTPPKPSVRIADARLTNLALDSATLAFDLEVANPYSVPLPLMNLEYSLASGGSPFLSGKAESQGTVPPKSSKVITVPAKMVFARVLESVKGIRPGSVVPYEVAMTLSVDAPAVGTLSLPISKKGQFPLPAVPSIELTEIHWQSLSFDRAVAVMKVKVGNRNEFPVDLSRLSLSLALADTPILSTAVDKPASFLAGQDNTLEIPISFAPRDLGLAAFQVIRGAGSGYKLSGLLMANTAFGAIDFPYEQTGQTRFR